MSCDWIWSQLIDQNLTHLYLSNGEYRTIGWQLCELLPFTNIKTLKIYCRETSPGLFHRLLEILPRTKITKLDLSYTNIGNYDELFKILPKTQITHLNIFMRWAVLQNTYNFEIVNESIFKSQLTHFRFHFHDSDGLIVDITHQILDLNRKRLHTKKKDSIVHFLMATLKKYGKKSPIYRFTKSCLYDREVIGIIIAFIYRSKESIHASYNLLMQSLVNRKQLLWLERLQRY